MNRNISIKERYSLNSIRIRAEEIGDNFYNFNRTTKQY